VNDRERLCANLEAVYGLQPDLQLRSALGLPPEILHVPICNLVPWLNGYTDLTDFEIKAAVQRCKEVDIASRGQLVNYLTSNSVADLFPDSILQKEVQEALQKPWPQQKAAPSGFKMTRHFSSRKKKPMNGPNGNSLGVSDTQKDCCLFCTVCCCCDCLCDCGCCCDCLFGAVVVHNQRTKRGNHLANQHDPGRSEDEVFRSV
jgi:hypothetical protein